MKIQFLTTDQTEAYQLNLARYLAGYREKHNITQEAAASDLGLSTSRYKVYEGNRPENTLIKSLDVLKRFAQLEKMSITEFVSALCDESPPSIEQKNKVYGEKKAATSDTFQDRYVLLGQEERELLEKLMTKLQK